MGLLSLNLPIIGQLNSTEDPKILTALTSIQTLVNGNLDAANTSHALFGAYRTVEQTYFTAGPAQITGAANFYLLGVGGAGSVVGSGVAASIAPAVVRSIPADYTISGLTTVGRVAVEMWTNATAPAITFTFQLFSLSGLGGGAGLITPTIGAGVAGSIATITTPALGTTTSAVSSDFTLPTSGGTAYVMGVASSGAMAANSYVAGTMLLQLRHT
jgi:hypothetical protein